MRPSFIRLVAAALIGFAAAPSVASDPVEMVSLPSREQSGMQRFGLTFEVEEAAARSLIATHRKQCTALGPARCRVSRASVGDSLGPYERASLQMVLAPGTAERFMTRLTEASPGIGFATENTGDYRNSDAEDADREIDRTLLTARRNLLLDLSKGGELDRRRQIAVSRKLADTTRELEEVETRLAPTGGASVGEILSVQYGVAHHQRSDSERLLDEAWPLFLLSLATVSGVALLTVLYLGILTGGALALRRLLRRRGVISADANQSEKAAPSLP